MTRPFTRLIQLVGMQPDNRCQPVARDVFRFQADLDLEGLAVHLDQPATKVVAVPRADQVRGRISFLHPGKRHQAFTFRFGNPDGRVSLGRQLNGLDLVVWHEGTRGQRGAKGDSVLVDGGDVARNDVTGAEMERPALVLASRPVSFLARRERRGTRRRTRRRLEAGAAPAPLRLLACRVHGGRRLAVNDPSRNRGT